MSMRSSHTGNGNPTETPRRREDTKAQLDGILQHFDVLPNRFDRLLFQYIYVYLIGLLVPADVLFIISLLNMNPQVGRVLVQGIGFGVFPVVAIMLVVWFFNRWRVRTAKTLRDLLEKKRIALPDGDTNTSYLRFLEHYRDALASPKRYFLSGFLMIVFGSIFVYLIAQTISSGLPHMLVMILVVDYLLFVFLYWGGFYCIGILTWAMYISGWYVRKLVRAFRLNIQPFHPDQCGGLMVLGNFCFGLILPLLIGSGLLIGYSIFALVEYAPSIYGSALSAIYLAANVGFPLLLLLYNVPVIVLAFLLPLRDIHTKMVSESEAEEDSYTARIEALRQEIQSLLEANQIEAAKAVQEKKALVETLYTPYPTWPFRVRSKIFSTVLGVSGSLLLGVITAAIQQYFLPAVVALLFHTP